MLPEWLHQLRARALDTLDDTVVGPWARATDRVARAAFHAGVREWAPARVAANARLGAFENRHAGERCVILGNGPSLSRTDLSLLKHTTSFGQNRIFLLFDELGFQTSYLVCVNRLVLEQSVAELSDLALPLFFAERGRDLFDDDENRFWLDTSGSQPGFTSDARLRMWEGGTVTYVSLQLAFFMGFSEVILVGVDHNFPAAKGQPHQVVVADAPDENHFAPNYFGPGFRWQLPDLQRSEVAYSIARHAYELAGRRVIDATVDGQLQVFEKMDWDALWP